MELTESQRTALEDILDAVSSGQSLIALSGAAGTGKTTLIAALIDALPEEDVHVCTPTNKAAQVLKEKGIDATTFFKKFYIPKEEVELDHKTGKVIKRKVRFVSCLNYKREEGLSQDSQLPPGKRSHVSTIIVDEASMVTHKICREMLKMCDTLILVGDHNQLPPVNDNDYPMGFFGDLPKTAELTEVLRQDEGSMILALASEIRNKGSKTEKLIDLMAPGEDDSFRDLVANGAQVICYTNNERRRVNHVCRRILGFNHPWPMPGDKMIVLNNFNDDLVNGTVVTVNSFDWDWNPTYVASINVRTPSGFNVPLRMDMCAFINDQIASQQDQLWGGLTRAKHVEESESVFIELTFAYCLTCHKSQGSEWPAVVVIDQRPVIHKIQSNDPRANMSPQEYIRRWMYTAVTRARKQLIVAPRWFAQSYDQVM